MACFTFNTGEGYCRPKRWSAPLSIALLALFYLYFSDAAPRASAAEPEGVARFQKEIKPILTKYCVGCHNAELKKGDIDFSQADTDVSMLENRMLWWKTLKMVRAGIMPPKNKPHPELEQIDQLVSWIKTSAFKIDPLDPDPGRVTVRRLNRTEYRNTIRDLLGVNFDTNAEFPADDSGHGFDNIGEVLTISPLLRRRSMLPPPAPLSGKPSRPRASLSPRNAFQERISSSMETPKPALAWAIRSCSPTTKLLLLRPWPESIMPATIKWFSICRPTRNMSTACSTTTNAGWFSKSTAKPCSIRNIRARAAGPGRYE